MPRRPPGMRQLEIRETTRSKAMTGADISFRPGQAVRWPWSGSHASGTIVERFERRVQRTLGGAKIVRNGTQDNPAYLVEQSDGARVLKLGSELEAE